MNQLVIGGLAAQNRRTTMAYHGDMASGRRRSHDEAAALMVERGFQPIEPYPGSDKRWRCICLNCGEECETSFHGVFGHGIRKCQTCSGHKIHPGKAEEVMRNARLEPQVPYQGANVPWLCRCEVCGSFEKPRYNDIRQGRSGCRACGVARRAAAANGKFRKEVLGVELPGQAKKKKSADAVRETTRISYSPVEVMNAANFEPLEPYTRSSSPWRCACKVCGRESTPRLSDVRRGVGCAWCAGQRIHPSEALEVMRQAGFEPLTEYVNALSPWPCVCSACGRESSPMYHHVRRGHGCAWCAGLRLDPADATARMVEAGLHPLEEYPGVDKSWLCECGTCKRQIRPTFKNVMNGSRCRFCSDGGFSYTAPGVVYLLRHERHFALKVGITTTEARTDRIAVHTKHDWQQVARWDVPTGDHAEQIEQAVLAWWRDELEAPYAVPQDLMPQGGWSETASLLWVDQHDTIAYINRLLALDKDRASQGGS